MNNKTLVVAFENLSSTLVNLPPAWAHALWNQLESLKSGQVVLSLKWRSKRSHGTEKKSAADARKAFVVWAGGAATKDRRQQSDFVEIDAQYGRALGLREGQTVNVEFCKDVAVGRSVNVEPLSVDDWEILELHAGYLEAQFLNQVRVVWKDQILTVWVHGQTVIKLKVIETDPDAPCVTLDTDAEVIVAPKQRWTPAAPAASNDKATANETASTPSQSARLLPIDAFNPSDVGIADDPALPTIYLPQLKADGSTYDGSIVYMTKRDFTPVRQASADDADTENAAGDAKEEVVGMPKGVYVHCRHVPRLPVGHLWANAAVQTLLGLTAFTRVRLRVTADEPLRQFKLAARPITATASEQIVIRKSQADVDAAVKALREYLGRITFHTGHALITDGTIHEVPLNIQAATTTHVVIGVLPAKPSATADLGRKKPLFARLDAIVVEDVTIDIQSKVVVKGFGETAKARPVPRLAGVDELMKQLMTQLRCRIASPLIRRSMRTPAPGGILLYGSRGFGKTSIVNAATHAMAVDHESLAHSEFLDCTELARERIPKIKDALQQAIYRAAWYSPSILVLDDLDRLLPAEQEHADSSRSRQLTEVFVDLAETARVRFGIVLLATCQQRTSVNASLLTQHVFSEVLHILPPSKIQRQQILERMVLETGVADATPQSLDLSSVAGTTDGYSPSDLYTLTQRAVHEAAMRHLDSAASSTLASADHSAPEGRGEDMKVASADFERAQDGFVPASLKGVKLEKGGGVEWADVGGLKETKRTLLETLEWPTKYAAIFANCSLRLRSGLLLYGFPGCGKTLLASAVAKECGLNFISVKGPELLNKYIGASEQSVRDLFERASAAKPCILFFDEFDAIAPRRGNDNTGVTDRVVNQMLTQMDGAEGLDGVYVLAATSRPDIIDPALLRPGRLDKSLLCGMPDADERLEILKAVAGKLTLDPAVALEEYARQTEGFSGADLQALLYNAHLGAIHHVLDAIDDKRHDDASPTDAGAASSKDIVVVQRGEVQTLTAVETGELASKIKVTQRNVFESLQPGSSRADGPNPSQPGHAPHKTVITAADLDTALRDARPSISAQEKARLQRIYEGFLGGKPPGGAESVGQRSTMA
ncbi:P-loop containing nucleoside triphosphate hydrolase protein [Geranomyces variabilis]|nr:P-loop containing nucleoside triphosphate hydrolase protein [Geranomyces variabilis]KAJ3133622.1 Peroxisome biosynthesis protein pex1 [Geranomyces variabilis]